MKFIIGEDRSAVSFDVKELGKDLVVIITGGEAHIGAIALALARKSLRDHTEISASASLLSVPGHKEEDIVLLLAREITKGTHKNCTVVAGIHLDTITREELDSVWKHCTKGAQCIIEHFVGKNS